MVFINLTQWFSKLVNLLFLNNRLSLMLYILLNINIKKDILLSVKITIEQYTIF